MPKTKKRERRMSISLSEIVYQRLIALSIKQDRSLSWVAGRAIEVFLENQEGKHESKSN